MVSIPPPLIHVIHSNISPPDTRSYIPPVQIGAVMRGAVIGKVLASKAPSLAVGSYVTASPGWTELSILPSKEVTPIDIPSNGSVTDVLGVLGMTGLTAYFGMLSIGNVQPGDFVVVSGAAGATGSIACQIAKLKGARVLGLAGSDDKVKWLKELGCDEALNYKSATFVKDFKEKTKDLIDVFFDNVGGEILELALSRAKAHARFVMCGGELISSPFF
jgi:NADPH-dependent curcumin reductase CurA